VRTRDKKAFCALEFVKTETIVTVQGRLQTKYCTEPLTDKTIREWYKKFSKVAACALRNEQAGRGHRPRLSRVCEKLLSGALRSQDIPRAGNCRCLSQVSGVFCANVFAAHARQSWPMAPAGLFVLQRTGSQSARISCSTHELFCT
jgi:hypothetical protein